VRVNLARAALILSIAILGVASVRGDEAPTGPDARAQDSNEQIRGTVQAVYTKNEDRANSVKTYYLFEILVSALEKGDSSKVGDLLYVRAFSIEARPGKLLPTGSSGHRPLPKTGDRLRVFIVKGPYSSTGQTDSGRSAFYPDGFEILP